VNEKNDLWYWYHNVSECYYHIQLTVKYRKALLDKEVEGVILESMKGFQERYAIEIQQVGFDRDHIHILCRFLPKYSGGQVIRIIKSITAQQIFRNIPRIKRNLWGGEFWTDGYYIATISGRGDKKVIEAYIRKQGKEEHIKQLRLFEL
jgi:REP-associated tyrosine transposase